MYLHVHYLTKSVKKFQRIIWNKKNISNKWSTYDSLLKTLKRFFYWCVCVFVWREGGVQIYINMFYLLHRYPWYPWNTLIYMFPLTIYSLKKLWKLSCDQQNLHNSQSPLNILYVLKHLVLLLWEWIRMFSTKPI